MSPLRQVMVVFRKELRDAMRDRRSVTSALLMPVLGPVTIAIMFSAIASWTRQDKPLRVPVVHAERAPNLVAFLERNGAEVVPAPADAEAQVKDGKLDLALVVTDDYAGEFGAGRTARLELLVDHSRNKARVTVQRALRLLRTYSAQLGGLRLLARGVSPALATPVVVEEVDLSTPEKLAANLLGSVPIFLLMAAFVSGMYLAIDATAGERERGSLEPLLVNPVTRQAVIGGKWMATVVSAWIGVAVALAGFMVAFQKVPLQDLGVKLQFGGAQAAAMLALLVPLTLFASAIQVLMALYARTFKEAQTYLSLMMLVPVLPATATAVSPVEAKAWMMAVPVLSQTLLLGEAMRGDPVKLAWSAGASLVTLLAAGACLAAAARLLGQEKIVFGRSS